MSNETKGVSNCYVFKSRLQEYAQKVGFSTPVYETIKEGPSHQPFFKSTVVVNDVRYDSLPGFSNRKAAEQSAAEIALMELVKSGDMKECIAQPVHETGLCKNLLQEYAQKMNYAMPAYECRRHDTAGRAAHFSCTVEIGGIRYIGAIARTKKEAEIKAARTALLAIQSSPSLVGEAPNEEIRYTVVPSKRKEPETATGEQDAAKAQKPKKGRFKRKPQKKRQNFGEGDQSQCRTAGPVPADLGGQATGAPSGDGLLDTPMQDCIQLAVDQTGNMDGPQKKKQNFGEGDQSQCRRVGPVPADLGGQATGAPSGDDVLDTPMQDCIQLAVDQRGNMDGPPTTDHNHTDPLSLDGLEIPNVGISDGQTTPMNPAPVQDGIMNITHQLEGSSTVQDGSIPSGNGFSNNPDPDSMQTSNIVECDIQTSPLSQSNIPSSQQYNNGGSSGPDHSSAPLSDPSPLFSSDGFSNSQVSSEFQPLSEGATGAIEIDKPNTNDTLKDGSSEVSAVSLVNNVDSTQKSDAVKQPEGNGNYGETKDYSSVAVEQVGSEVNASAASIDNQTTPGSIEPAASSANHVEDSSLQASKDQPVV